MTYYADIHLIDEPLTYSREECGTDGEYTTTLDATIAREGGKWRLAQAVEWTIRINGEDLPVPSYMHSAWFGYLLAGGVGQLEKHIKTDWKRAS